MNKRNFIAVPTKTAYDLDLASRVSTYMQTCLSLTPEVTNAVKEGLDELNRLRRNAFLHDECGKTVASIDTMHRYYDCFCSLDEKVQIKDGECPVPFRYKAAFDRSSLFSGRRELTHNNGGYEKACVLFNIAAYQSRYAASVELSSDENLRQAVRYFQSSANIFDYLKSSAMHLIPDELPKDMQPQLLNALAQILITQANEIMYWKASKDSSSPAALRALAMQLSDMYGVAYKHFNYEQAKGIVDKSWYAILQGKEAAWQAQASKHQLDDLESGKLDAIEERLARAKEVLELYEKAEHLHPKTYDQEVRTAEIEWKKIEKDNNLIYHARILPKSELTALPRKAVLNIGSLKTPFTKDFKDIFIQLVSVHANKAVNAFQGRFKEHVHKLLSDLRTHVTTTRAGLAAINMPALVEDETKQERLPASIIKKSEDLRSKGGFGVIENREKELARSSTSIIERLNQVKSKLAAEEESDKALREHYSARWTCADSTQLTLKFKMEMSKYQGINDTATSANKKVESKVRLCERDAMVLTGPKEGLLERVPPITHASGDKSQSIGKLRELWTVMEKELNSASTIESRLGSLNYDPTAELLSMLKRDGDLNDSRVGDFTNAKLAELCGATEKEIAANKEQRQNVLEEMRVWHQRFSSESSTDDTRTKALQQLAAAYDTFLECEANLEEGIKFYSDLNVLLTRLQQQVDDFVFARQTEKEELLGVLEPGKRAADQLSTIVNSYRAKSGGDARAPAESRQPPPRPPPPSSSALGRVPEMQHLNIGEQPAAGQPPSPLSHAPAPNAQPPSVPPHQGGYNPNVGQPPQWYGQQQPQWPGQPGNPFGGQQGFQYAQPGYQQMPHLPFYGAFQQQGGMQPNMAAYPPYPMQYPVAHPQPYGQPPQQQQQQQPQPPPRNNTNPFAQ